MAKSYFTDQTIYCIYVELLGVTLNGMFMWNRLLKQYEANILRPFRLQDRFLHMANRKMLNIRTAFLKSPGMSGGETSETELAMRQKSPELVYVGIHVR